MNDSADTKRGVFGWLDQRYGLSPLIEFLRHKEVPVGHHSMVWYYLGGATLFFFAVQVLSGVLLLMYYQAGAETSYESILYITTKVPFGWLVRSVHCWSAHLMIISLITHMLSTMMLKAYRPPRELTWVTGFLLFAIALGFGFSGYLLPWNELAFFATAVGTDSVKSVPVIGEWLLQVMRGGPDVTINTLYRFFALHVVILPLGIVAIVSLHLLFIQRQGMALPVGHTKMFRGMKFFPDFMMRDLLLWLIALIVLVTLAVFLPYGPGIPGVEWELGRKADPLAPAYPGIKPEWYFLWVYQLLKEFPPHILGMEGSQAALLVVTVLMTIWALIPWLDRRAARNQDSPVFGDLGVAAIIFLSFLTLKAWDIGAPDPEAPQAPAQIAWMVGWIVLVGGVLVGLGRWLLQRVRWQALSLAALLHVFLHGIVGLSYLLAGSIAASVAAIAIVITVKRAGRPASSATGARS